MLGPVETEFERCVTLTKSWMDLSGLRIPHQVALLRAASEATPACGGGLCWPDTLGLVGLQLLTDPTAHSAGRSQPLGDSVSLLAKGTKQPPCRDMEALS